MASYAVPAGQTACHDNQLTAGLVDTVTFANAALEIEVITDGTAKVYVTTDGSTPTISGANTILIPATMSGIIIRNPTETTPTISLISSGTPMYSVMLA